jgi:hypothetical protein
MDEVRETLRSDELSDPRVESKSSSRSWCCIAVSQLSEPWAFKASGDVGKIHQHRFPGHSLAEMDFPCLMLVRRRPWMGLMRPWTVFVQERAQQQLGIGIRWDKRRGGASPSKRCPRSHMG